MDSKSYSPTRTFAYNEISSEKRDPMCSKYTKCGDELAKECGGEVL